jgi:uncharacterized membrane protein SirB2
MERSPHILNAAATLLGICLVIITGLTLTKSNDRSLADEIAWFAVFMFLISVALSFLALRLHVAAPRLVQFCDVAFFLGVASLTLSACVAYVALG